jgi:redox-sensing transcriptional repressor
VPAALRRRAIADATVERLPVYLRSLTAYADSGVTTVSSQDLAGSCGVGPAKLRRDLSQLGSYGVRGVGYDVRLLIEQISRALGLTQHHRVVIVGVGNLGHALANYAGFSGRGFQIAALVDSDQAQVGELVAGRRVCHLDDLEIVVKEHDVSIGVIATPAGSAQEVADRLVACDVTSILNFAPCVLSVPDLVDVRQVDLSLELSILAFHEQRKTGSDG